MSELPEKKADRAFALRSMVTSLATGGELVDSMYQQLRDEFLSDAGTKNLLPAYVRNNFDGEGLWAHLKGVHTGMGAYAARREYIETTFQALIDHLIDSGAPADTDVTAALSSYNGDGVHEAWQRALARRASDPEGAITAARTLLEEVCKHILDDAGQEYSEAADLPKLYSSCAKLMNLAPSQHTEEAFKRILGSCQAIVETLGNIRNRVSDAHGAGRKKVKPSPRHAALAVNLAGAMAMFIVETWADSSTHKSEPNGPS